MCCKDIGIRKSEFVAKTLFLFEKIGMYILSKKNIPLFKLQNILFRWSHRSSLGTILDEEEDDDSSEVDDFEMKDESYTLDELEQMDDSNETLDEDFNESKNEEYSSELGKYHSNLKRGRYHSFFILKLKTC